MDAIHEIVGVIIDVTVVGGTVILGFLVVLIVLSAPVEGYMTYRAWKRGEEISPLDRFIMGPSPEARLSKKTEEGKHA